MEAASPPFLCCFRAGGQNAREQAVLREKRRCEHLPHREQEQSKLRAASGSLCQTTHSQQRVVNSTFTTARRQQHIHNKTLPDIIMKRVYGSKRDGNAKGLTFLELAQTIHICVHTAYVQQFWQENYSMHKHVWYKCTVLANPNHTL